MTKASIKWALILTLTLTGAALAQQPPSENKGMKATPLAAFDLGKQGLKDLDQRQMRMRVIQVEPGGAAAFHSHSQRPALTYVLKGSLLEHRKGSADRTYAQARLSSRALMLITGPRTKAPRPPRSFPLTCSRNSVPDRQVFGSHLGAFGGAADGPVCARAARI